MKPTRKLALKREQLTELGSEDLSQVAGGTHANCLTLPLFECLSIMRCFPTHQLLCNLPVPTLPDTCLC